MEHKRRRRRRRTDIPRRSTRQLLFGDERGFSPLSASRAEEKMSLLVRSGPLEGRGVGGVTGASPPDHRSSRLHASDPPAEDLFDAAERGSETRSRLDEGEDEFLGEQGPLLVLLDLHDALLPPDEVAAGGVDAAVPAAAAGADGERGEVLAERQAREVVARGAADAAEGRGDERRRGGDARG
ncbi:uncharacterized protein K489DRAFT_102108 [Dissoconium aciculare CBS 342.82]|uniref:Uncharacterized protein n=1 Tax=Dissoconium aciculare CBS 342.82 TaxID=1314786 RepID=A0A6J3MDH6_9PEZI|nr:uncharacterized protein K489DRAFT_102108 [Dissoconium aciculare CBS 342.82]KAF1825933.1 hypothetical protein K489DRAFT_102108 [Dissoconium aciculare CBS 342.82]